MGELRNLAMALGREGHRGMQEMKDHAYREEVERKRAIEAAKPGLGEKILSGIGTIGGGILGGMVGGPAGILAGSSIGGGLGGFLGSGDLGQLEQGAKPALGLLAMDQLRGGSMGSDLFSGLQDLGWRAKGFGRDWAAAGNLMEDVRGFPGQY